MDNAFRIPDQVGDQSAEWAGLDDLGSPNLPGKDLQRLGLGLRLGLASGLSLWGLSLGAQLSARIWRELTTLTPQPCDWAAATLFKSCLSEHMFSLLAPPASPL